MNPTTVVSWLTSAGPYAVTAIVLVWLRLEREERIKAQEDARVLRDQRYTEMREQTELIVELGEITRNRLRDHDSKIERAIEIFNARAGAPSGVLAGER